MPTPGQIMKPCGMGAGWGGWAAGAWRGANFWMRLAAMIVRTPYVQVRQPSASIVPLANFPVLAISPKLAKKGPKRRSSVSLGEMGTLDLKVHHDYQEHRKVSFAHVSHSCWSHVNSRQVGGRGPYGRQRFPGCCTANFARTAIAIWIATFYICRRFRVPTRCLREAWGRVSSHTRH